MKLTKVVFSRHVSGVFGHDVFALSAEQSPSMPTVASLEVGSLGLIITKLDGEVKWVPTALCESGTVAPPEAAEGKPAKGGKAA